MRIETQLRHRARLAESLRNIWNNAKRFGWSHDEILSDINRHVWDTPEFAKMTREDRGYLRGVADTLLSVAMSRDVVTCYEMRKTGQRVALHSPEWDRMFYNQASLSEQIDTESADSRWAHDLSKVFSGPVKKSTQVA